MSTRFDSWSLTFMVISSDYLRPGSHSHFMYVSMNAENHNISFVSSEFKGSRLPIASGAGAPACVGRAASEASTTPAMVCARGARATLAVGGTTGTATIRVM